MFQRNSHFQTALRFFLLTCILHCTWMVQSDISEGTLSCFGSSQYFRSDVFTLPYRCLTRSRTWVFKVLKSSLMDLTTFRGAAYPAALSILWALSLRCQWFMIFQWFLDKILWRKSYSFSPNNVSAAEEHTNNQKNIHLILRRALFWCTCPGYLLLTQLLTAQDHPRTGRSVCIWGLCSFLMSNYILVTQGASSRVCGVFLLLCEVGSCREPLAAVLCITLLLHI